MISIDSETTGVDFGHGTMPFFITVCYENGSQSWWEWDVDPETRMVTVDRDDVEEVLELVHGDNELVLQNAKFDVHALSVLDNRFADWPWSKTHDTLIAGHLLASNKPHDLTSMAMQYARINVQPLEDKLKEACLSARRWCKRYRKKWRIASADLEDMPSAKEKTWKFDSWLPRTVARECGYSLDHPWYSVLSDYSNGDSLATLAVWSVQQLEIKRRDLWSIYEARMKLPPIITGMESHGVTINKRRLYEQKEEYSRQSEEAGRICLDIAQRYDYDLTLPTSGNNNSLKEFVFGRLGLTPVKRSDKTGEPSLDKEVMDWYSTHLRDGSEELHFIQSLMAKRKRDTAINYMDGYERFWVPLVIGGRVIPDWYVLHPSLNATGSATLRFSSSNPNEQNVSKQPGFNLRYCFGPAPGREWWSFDAENIELRIPAYLANEREMIQLFERPTDPPYYGSNHLLVSHILHPKLFEECINKDGILDGRLFKDRYKGTWYQWIKNGNFAVQYGAIVESGTADRAYHVPGAQQRIQERFSNIAKLNKVTIQYAEKYGYVETVPDVTVNPRRGYPIYCTRSEWGRILPTVPLNYKVQGTAMWWMQKAMVRCDAKLSEWNRAGFNGYMILQVHDELDFDWPRGYGKEPWKKNYGRAMEIKRLMEEGGRDIGIPTPVSVSYHAENWSEGIEIR
jgi:DNA polymerase I-like protein with 3'-5' exonuclease and polymerase domains